MFRVLWIALAKMLGWYCGITTIKFGRFLRIPSLYVLAFVQKIFVLVSVAFFFRNGKKERRYVGGEAKGKMHSLYKDEQTVTVYFLIVLNKIKSFQF